MKLSSTFIKSFYAFGLPTLVSLPLVAQELSESDYRELDRFASVIEQIQSDYVEPVELDDLIDAAINGMLTSLDPHSSYLSGESYTQMQEDTSGEFSGLGIVVTQEDGLVKVVSPIDDSPATQAGIEAGDFITHVDGETLIGLNLNDAIEKLRGPIGSTILVTIVREGEAEPFDVEVTREAIKTQSARVSLEGDVAIIRIAQFNEQTFPNMMDDLAKVEEEIGGKENISGFIVDLRNNPGGLLPTAIQVSDAFLEQGEIVSTRGRDENDSSRNNATPGDITDGKPIVVLIDRGSASASEIVAGALKDHRRAVIVGTTSFGKGSVQTIMPVDRESAIRLTTQRYFTPSGRSIQGLGVEPDVYIEYERPSQNEENETTSQAFGKTGEGSLQGALENDSLTEEQLEVLEAERIEREEQSKLRETDNQLAYAIDIIHSLDAIKAE